MAGQYYVSKKYHEISMLAGETAKQVSEERGGMGEILKHSRKAV